MKQIPIFGFVLLCLLTIPGIAWIQSSSSPGRREDYSHAYYLFLAGVPKGCEDCYVPLLITKEPLERLTNTKGNAACVLIITYERDSIWHDDGFVSVLPSDIEAGPRTVRLNSENTGTKRLVLVKFLNSFRTPWAQARYHVRSCRTLPHRGRLCKNSFRLSNNATDPCTISPILNDSKTMRISVAMPTSRY